MKKIINGCLPLRVIGKIDPNEKVPPLKGFVLVALASVVGLPPNQAKSIWELSRKIMDAPDDHIELKGDEFKFLIEMLSLQRQYTSFILGQILAMLDDALTED